MSVIQARWIREAQDTLGESNHQPQLIAERFRDRADELSISLLEGQQLASRQEFVRVVQDISQSNRATFAGGQHPIDPRKEMELLARRGIRFGVVALSIGDFVIGS
ncbi:MAG: hypothetical protein OXI41_01790 [Chloroflexota bacterium]|nr:hypothetical protein [Chloroflexota bacterium]MDE2894190.1 hypothetical protein [Chloroflexota bacterium]